jgi:hypothetical protein
MSAERVTDTRENHRDQVATVTKRVWQRGSERFKEARRERQTERRRQWQQFCRSAAGWLPHAPAVMRGYVAVGLPEHVLHPVCHRIVTALCSGYDTRLYTGALPIQQNTQPQSARPSQSVSSQPPQGSILSAHGSVVYERLHVAESVRSHTVQCAGKETSACFSPYAIEMSGTDGGGTHSSPAASQRPT